MKSRILIYLSALALMVLIITQFLFVTDTYATKQNQFYSRYGSMVKKGMAEFTSQDFNFAFDSVLYSLNNLALEYLYEKKDTALGSPGEVFLKSLEKYREPQIFLMDYVRKAGEEPDFTYHLQLNELTLVGLGYKKMVYPDSLV